MMYLAQNVFLATIDDRSVALDLNSDRYTGLNASLTRALHLLIDPAATALDSGQAAKLAAARSTLVEKNILSDVSRPVARRQPSEVASTLWAPTWAEIAAAQQNRALRHAQFSALIALLQVSLALWIWPLGRTINWLGRQKADPRRSKLPLTEGELLAAYANARPWFPLKPICRLDALAICLLFNRYGYSADVVFGVRLDPFLAHCWAQFGSTVLNEPHESARKYTPIMTV